MQPLKIIRKRIISIKNIQKVTNAMKLVAAAKLKRFQRDAVNSRYYTHELIDIAKKITNSHSKEISPYAPKQDPIINVDFVVFTSDRGLCGVFNDLLCKKVLKKIEDFEAKGKTVRLFIFGKKGWKFFKSKHGLIEVISSKEKISFTELAAQITIMLTERFNLEACQEVYLCFNKFENASKSEVTFWRFLPVSYENGDIDHTSEYLFEPGYDEVYNSLIKATLNRTVEQVLYESKASELVARVMAMDSATRNADDIISDLGLNYNKARQSAITRELLDIISGAEALT